MVKLGIVLSLVAGLTVVGAGASYMIYQNIASRRRARDNSGNTGDNSGNTGDNSGNTGDNSGNTGDNSGNTGDNSGNTGDNSSNTESNQSINSAATPTNVKRTGRRRTAKKKKRDTISYSITEAVLMANFQLAPPPKPQPILHDPHKPGCSFWLYKSPF